MLKMPGRTNAFPFCEFLKIHLRLSRREVSRNTPSLGRLLTPIAVRFRLGVHCESTVCVLDVSNCQSVGSSIGKKLVIGRLMR